MSYRLDNGLDPLLGELLEANSKATLGIHAYLDLAVNYLGWEREDVRKYLSSYFSDPDSITDSMFEAWWIILPTIFLTSSAPGDPQHEGKR